MKNEELLKLIVETTVSIGELKGELEAVKRENEFLRGLLKEKLPKASDSTE